MNKSVISRISAFAIACALANAVLIGCSSDKNNGTLTQALDDACWEQAQWISVADAPVVTGKCPKGVRAADGASCFVRSFKNKGKVISAKWMATSLGVHEIQVNGVTVGDEILKPGFTHHDKTKISFTYDITEMIDRTSGAENTFSAQVTPGWWADKVVTPHNHPHMVGAKSAFRSVIELTYADGSKEMIGTDTGNWKAGIAGPVTHAAIFDGEDYDARILPAWKTPEKLSEPEINTEFNGEIVATDGAEVYLRYDIALDRKLAYTWTDVDGADDDCYGKVVTDKEFSLAEEILVEPGQTLVVDFGQNCAAVPSFVFKAAEGTQLTCLPGELLNDGNGAKKRGMDGPEGSVHRLNLRIPNDGMILRYTFAGTRGYETFTPTCTFFGYRYVSITATDAVRIKSIISIPVSSITGEMETGSIETGNELVNKLISNTWWGQLSNYLSVPTDCPQRDERHGWTADTQVFAETGTFFADTDRFFHKWMMDMRDTQSPKAGYPGVAPIGQYGANEDNMMRVGWADAGIIVPWTIWKQFGDGSIIDENWESMECYMDHVGATRYDHVALAEENGNYQWADWLSYEPLESCGGSAFTKVDGKRTPLPEAIEYWSYLSASYWISDAAMMLDMATASGRDAAKYEEMVIEAMAYAKERFLTADGLFKTEILNTMQTPALFALRNGLVDGQARDNMIQRLRDNFAEHDGCLQTGFLGTSILLPTLTDNGMSDIAYELLFQRKNPSWLYSVDNGATTIWERWNSYTLENGMGPKGMNSFNHYAYGVVCQWIWETAAGIAADPADPGFRHIIMKPVPDERLGWLSASYRSASGLIESAWRYEDGKWIWEFSISEGCTATVTLPGETESHNYDAGRYCVSQKTK